MLRQFYLYDLQTYLALEPGEYVVGRSEESDLIIKDSSVSRQHARLYVRADRVEVEDSGSRNGTHLNGRRIVRGTIEERAEVRFGNVVYHIADAAFMEDMAQTETRSNSDTVKVDPVLTLTEAKVLWLLLKGMAEKEIAREMGSKQNTVHSHVKKIYERFDVSSRGELLGRFVNEPQLKKYLTDPELRDRLADGTDEFEYSPE